MRSITRIGKASCVMDVQLMTITFFFGWLIDICFIMYRITGNEFEMRSISSFTI